VARVFGFSFVIGLAEKLYKILHALSGVPPHCHQAKKNELPQNNKNEQNAQFFCSEGIL